MNNLLKPLKFITKKNNNTKMKKHRVAEKMFDFCSQIFFRDFFDFFNDFR